MTRAPTPCLGEEDLLCPRLSDWVLILVSALPVEEGMQGVDKAEGSLRGAGTGLGVALLLGFISGAGGAGAPVRSSSCASTVCAQKQVIDGRGKNAAVQVSMFVTDWGRTGDERRADWQPRSRTHASHSGIWAPRQKAPTPVQVSATSNQLQTHKSGSFFSSNKCVYSFKKKKKSQSTITSAEQN